MKKRVLVTLLTGLLAISVAAGCGSKAMVGGEAAVESAGETEEEGTGADGDAEHKTTEFETEKDAADGITEDTDEAEVIAELAASEAATKNAAELTAAEAATKNTAESAASEATVKNAAESTASEATVKNAAESTASETAAKNAAESTASGAATNNTAESTASEITAENTEDKQYTFTDEQAVMYAKAVVNIRDLPGIEGNRIGVLALNEEVQVTGKCNESGWYRIENGGVTGYVSGSYLGTEKSEVQNTVSESAAAGSGTDTANVASSNASSDSSGTTFKMTAARKIEILDYMWDHTEAELKEYVTEEEWEHLVNKNMLSCIDSEVTMEEKAEAALAEAKNWNTDFGSEELFSFDVVYVGSTNTNEPGIAAAATALLELVNEDRANNGAPALEWSSELERVCLERVVELVADFSHNGVRECDGENIHYGSKGAAGANSAWIASERHHQNRINAGYTQYAAASYTENEITYWIELFKY